MSQYSPSGWDVLTVSAQERVILDTKYITFPVAQNENITFPVAPTAPTLPDGTNTTQVATTGFVQNALQALRSTVNTWLGINTFQGGISTSTINPVIDGGSITMGGALVPNYTYSTTGTGVGTIGEIKVGVNITGTDLSTTANTAKTISTIADLPVGVWLVYGTARKGTSSVGYVILSLTTTQNSISTTLGQDFTPTINGYGVQNIATVLVNQSVRTYYLTGQVDNENTWDSILFRMVRIA